ncbi:MAG: phosphoribosyl glycinamide formyltransferase [Burkholderiales bacterium]|nr:phosphoribosyl glycinamide formyltransferase [Burkholderiales bacterium]
MKDIRHVVFHRPGPAWLQGKGMFEQPGVAKHVEHYRQWHASGMLELGGPHVDEAGGGMMVPVAGVSEAEVRRFATADPAVQDGTLVVEVRPWLIGMSK